MSENYDGNLSTLHSMQTSSSIAHRYTSCPDGSRNERLGRTESSVTIFDVWTNGVGSLLEDF